MTVSVSAAEPPTVTDRGPDSVSPIMSSVQGGPATAAAGEASAGVVTDGWPAAGPVLAEAAPGGTTGTRTPASEGSTLVSAGSSTGARALRRGRRRAQGQSAGRRGPARRAATAPEGQQQAEHERPATPVHPRGEGSDRAEHGGNRSAADRLSGPARPLRRGRHTGRPVDLTCPLLPHPA